MEVVEVEAVPAARGTSHAAWTMRVAPRGEAGAIDWRFAPLESFVAAAARPQTPARAELRVRALRSKERAGNLNGPAILWWTKKTRPL